MGKFLDRFKKGVSGGAERIDKLGTKIVNRPEKVNNGRFRTNAPQKMMDVTERESDLKTKDKKENFDEFGDGFDDGLGYDPYYDEVNIQQAQKPESFHHFILENQYKDLEMDIRGYKDVWDKESRTWKIKRKEVHCFTDEEAEMIVRKAQSDLSPDIKLSRVQKESYGILMMSIYKQLLRLVRRIMEYQMGRYVSYELQGQMKSQAVKILDDLYRRICANYSRAVDGKENSDTHSSVRGQESLQNSGRDMMFRNRGYM
jgi:hypothetical protein